LAKILIPAGTKDIPVGQALCVVAESKEGLEKFTSYSQEEDGQTASQASQPQEQARPSSHSPPPPHPSFPPVDLPPHEVLSMPALSPTMVCCGLSTSLMAQNFLKVFKLRGNVMLFVLLGV
jgi:pyruvate dehydrogenase E2 component (dihydrolipoamide acetyltransferase)